MVLGFIAAANLSWINAVYQIIFMIAAILVGMNMRTWSIEYTSLMNSVLIAILLTDLTFQYGYFIYGFNLQLSAKQKYSKELIGLLGNTTSFVVFGLKVLLLLIESARMQYRFHLSQLTFIPEVRRLVNRSIE